MKSKLSNVVFLIFCAVTFSLWADNDFDISDFGSEHVNQPAKEVPFHVSSSADYIGEAKINKGYFKGDRLRFATAEMELGSIFYYSPAYTEGANVSLSYAATYLRWEQNPWFDQDHYYAVSLSFNGFSRRLDRWFWRAHLAANFDTQELSAQYTSYDILLWGRYEYCQNVGIHMGLLVQTGLRLDRVYPIIGADWQVNKDWKLNLVFPVNVSLDYRLTDHWFFSLAGRVFNVRYRVKPHEAHSRGLIRYGNVGAEVAIKYETGNMNANLHVGSTLGGTLRIANRNNHKPHHYYFDGSGYVGGEVNVRF